MHIATCNTLSKSSTRRVSNSRQNLLSPTEIPSINCSNNQEATRRTTINSLMGRVWGLNSGPPARVFNTRLVCMVTRVDQHALTHEACVCQAYMSYLYVDYFDIDASCSEHKTDLEFAQHFAFASTVAHLHARWILIRDSTSSRS